MKGAPRSSRKSSREPTDYFGHFKIVGPARSPSVSGDALISLPTATYRLQLRTGLTFADIENQLPYLSNLGISHLYLSPPFKAVTGSTHGYDIIDPTALEPNLGGRAGFSRLAAKAHARGLSIIIDIVPNHTAFSLQNPWLLDILRHGPNSRFARHFDIDWSKGQLVLPFLEKPLDAMLRAGRLRIAADRHGLMLSEGSETIPFRPDTALPDHLRNADALRDLLAAQHWRLTHWENEREGITHRRFFNVTGLIGMRVEDPVVFDDMHCLIVDMITSGEVQGLRVDHIDGLADPAAYLHRLRQSVGDTVPIWVEKILTGNEDLPDWPVQGTTGYEAGRAISRVLTDAAGLARLDDAWRAATGQQSDFPTALFAAKAQVLQFDLAAELHQLIGLAKDALSFTDADDAGDEALREALLALLSAFPRYRTYFASGFRTTDDVRLMRGVCDLAAASLSSDRVIRAVTDLIATADSASAVALQLRFQQVTGALLAKSHEDTAGFRWNRYLAANEVGADPELATLRARDFNGWMGRRLARSPGGLTLTSSHDTKRAEDARMRLVAISHLPEAFLSLWRVARLDETALELDPDLAWYILQSVLAVWEPDRDDLEQRVVDHVGKAMREAKLVTNWSHPDTAAESLGQSFARHLVQSWNHALPDDAQKLMRLGSRLSLMQLVLKMTMPGVPDIYQGTEFAAFNLTDPDNRRPVDFARLQDPKGGSTFDMVKAKLTRTLAGLRRDHPVLFATGFAEFSWTQDGLSMLRILRAETVRVTVSRKTITVEGPVNGRPACILDI